MRVMVMGVTGMLGSTMLRRFSKRDDIETIGTCRRAPEGWPAKAISRLIERVDADDFGSIAKAVSTARPDVVVNCIGVIKQLPSATDPVLTIGLNALFPHRLAALCEENGVRLVHISTDCVFTGSKGSVYAETDTPDADDLYGRTKCLGEVNNGAAVTLRTSIIGHELKQKLGLVEWFLSQGGKIRGYTKAVFSGFPTCELSDIIADNVLPNKDLRGLYQVSSSPISKFELLTLVGKQYASAATIIPDGSVEVNKSLDSSRFQRETGYAPPAWSVLVQRMHQDFLSIRNDLTQLENN